MSADFQTLLRKTDDALIGGLKICIIARGVPGRGKTTLVERIVRHYNDNGEFTAIMSASDDFMIDSSGLFSSKHFYSIPYSVGNDSTMTFNLTNLTI